MESTASPRNDDGAAAERGFSIHGRVQGVGFRWWTRKTAEALGLTGSVRNRPDGAVEIRARGPGDALDTFEERIGRGPSSARVEEVSRISSELPLPENGFQIVR